MWNLGLVVHLMTNFYSKMFNKRGGRICIFYRSDLLFENFEVVLSEYFACCFTILNDEGKTLLLIAVYRTSGGNVRSSIENFSHFFEENRLLYDRILLLGDMNITLTTTNNISTS